MNPHKNLKTLSLYPYDAIIVGGGVTGACIARDAAMRGLRVVLLEAKDFCHATSAGSSKLIHGGLRYLENYEFGLVREALRERRIWEIIAPHLVHPLPFCFPIHGDSTFEKYKLRAGLTLYDILSLDRIFLNDPAKRLPGHKYFTPERTCASFPQINPHKLMGALTYYDCQMDSPERLGLECVLSAVDHGAEVANYMPVTELLTQEGHVKGVRVQSKITGETTDLKSELVINATGPWADEFVGNASGRNPGVKLLRSKGIHIVTRALTDRHALFISGDHEHLFVMPWRGHSLIGTTDTVYTGSLDEVYATQDDIDKLIGTVNVGLPHTNLKMEDVLHAYAGIRPLIGDSEASGDDSYTASRKSEIMDHADSGMPGLISALGGKWTTSRALAKKVVNLACRRLHREKGHCRTHRVPLFGGAVGKFDAFLENAVRRNDTIDAPIISNLVRTYGEKYRRVLRYHTPECERLSPAFQTVPAQIRYAVKHEFALSLEDVLFRRTGLATLKHPGAYAVERVADIMAEELEWSPEMRAAQIDAANTKLKAHHSFEPIAKAA